MDNTWVNVQSSTIDAIQYDVYTQTLGVRFNAGTIYQYFDVPPQYYTAFLEAPSKGRFFLAAIKAQGFKFKRIR